MSCKNTHPCETVDASDAKKQKCDSEHNGNEFSKIDLWMSSTGNALGYGVVYTNDVAKSVQLYKDLFGFSVHEPTNPNWTQLNTGTTSLGFHLTAEKAPVKATEKKNVAGMSHPTFLVPDVNSFHTRAIELGLTVVKAPEKSAWGTSATYGDFNESLLTVMSIEAEKMEKSDVPPYKSVTGAAFHCHLLYVKDVPAVIEWIKDNFGFIPRSTQFLPYWAEIECGSTSIGLHSTTDEIVPDSDRSTPVAGDSHVTFLTRDINTLHKQLIESNSVHVISEPTKQHWGGTQAKYGQTAFGFQFSVIEASKEFFTATNLEKKEAKLNEMAAKMRKEIKLCKSDKDAAFAYCVLHSTNVANTIKLFQELFAFEVRGQASEWWTELNCGTTALSVHKSPAADTVVKAEDKQAWPGKSGMTHPCFYVKDIQATHEKAVALGCKVIAAPSKQQCWGGEQATYADADEQLFTTMSWEMTEESKDVKDENIFFSSNGSSLSLAMVPVKDMNAALQWFKDVFGFDRCRPETPVREQWNQLHTGVTNIALHKTDLTWDHDKLAAGDSALGFFVKDLSTFHTHITKPEFNVTVLSEPKKQFWGGSKAEYRTPFGLFINVVEASLF